MTRARQLSNALAGHAEAVCRTYLPNGARAGNYWIAGDVNDAKGESLWVRIRGPRERVGRWRDEAVDGHYGDLLDLIRFACACPDIKSAMTEAERFLGAPRPPDTPAACANFDDDQAKRRKARKLFERGCRVEGSHAEAYFRARGLKLPAPASLRYHANAMYLSEDGKRRSGPAVLAAIRNIDRELIGVHRTWFEIRDGRGVAVLRKIMGQAAGGAVDLGGEGVLPLVGEGWETTYSLAGAIPATRLYAALSTGKLPLWRYPINTDAFLIAVDRDRNRAGERAAARLMERASDDGVAALPLRSRLGDFNDDLQTDGFAATRQRVRAQVEQLRALGLFPSDVCKERARSTSSDLDADGSGERER